MFKGLVVHGDKMGRTLGYPTANLDILIKDTKCKPGIYAATVTLKKKKYNAALVLNIAENKVEAHLFDYAGPEFYGAFVEIDPIQKVSEIEYYDNLKDLKEKIDEDIQLVRNVFKM